KELDSWIDDHEYLVTKDVYIHIKEKYGVDYSLKQVREIISCVSKLVNFLVSPNIVVILRSQVPARSYSISDLLC
ncbi:MAG: winged helix-turn-helix domain-containing protein, partial [Methanobrevibacter sp.]|nr:winged helix-turn-helix domain-containing protein [Candidatus Methanoflexus mossambicus]